MPDLQVSALAAPTQAVSGERVPVSWTITNTGTAAATNWTDRVYLSRDEVLDANDVKLGSDVLFTGTLQPGASIEQQVEFTIPQTLSGAWRVIVATDAANQHYEYPNETNNILASGALDITLRDFPNLRVTALTTPLDTASSQPVEVVWTVTNTGQGPTSCRSGRTTSICRRTPCWTPRTSASASSTTPATSRPARAMSAA
ncbi:MAG: hypothetical protein HC779_06490 [Phyllobacteriaceae bacterium]|nr:hypothetical protein [Phyllobacteriaceae bacterium]